MLKFNVQNQIIKRTDSLLPVADSRNYLKAEFKVTDEWQGAIAAVFGYGKSFYRVLLDDDNCCIVPWEVIKAPQFTVSLYCEGESLITSNAVGVLVEPSGMKEGAQPTEPTPEIWQQYMSKMQQNIENQIPYIGENGNWYFYNTELGVYTDSGILAAPEKGVDYWTEADKEEVQKYIDKQIGNVETSLEEHVSYATSQRGYLENLSTTDKSNLVAAINEVDGKIDNITSFIVNVTVYTDGTVEFDKTDSEISGAYDDGKAVLAYVEYYGGNKGDAIISQGKEVQILTLVRYEWVTRYKFWFTSIDSTDTEAYQVTALWNEGAKMDWGGNIVDNGWRIETVSISSKDYVDDQIGDIETALDSLQYYGDASIIPSDANYFDFTTDSKTMTASVKLKEEFKTDQALTKIVVPYKYINSNNEEFIVTNIGYEAFWNCTGLTSITIPNSVISIHRYAFENCTSLTSITIPSSVTSIDHQVFLNCTSLTSITIPSSVTTIGGWAFSDCTKLTSITILSGVTSIGDSAFENCTSLTSVTIPSSVTSIGYDAFAGCEGLTITCAEGSCADTYAKENGINVEYTDEVTKGYVDNQIGNIETALDNIIAIQNELIGGETV